MAPRRVRHVSSACIPSLFASTAIQVCPLSHINASLNFATAPFSFVLDVFIKARIRCTLHQISCSISFLYISIVAKNQRFVEAGRTALHAEFCLGTAFFRCLIQAVHASAMLCSAGKGLMS